MAPNRSRQGPWTRLRARGRGAVLARAMSDPAIVCSEGVLLNMRVTACPFCGVPTDVPHENQELCIAALHGEIALMRAMVRRRVKAPQTEKEESTEEPQVPDPA
jgi:hypothetical protein